MSTGQRLYQLEQGSASRPRTGRPVVHATRGVVSSGHYLTSMAGMRMLMSGGNAIDAMVSATFAAAVVEPIASYSLGAESVFMLYDARSGDLRAVSGQGVAPGAADIDFYRSLDLKEIPTGPGKQAHLSFTVPGVADALIAMLDRYGTKELGEVLAPAIEYAQEGIPNYEYMIAALDDGSTREQFDHYPPGGWEVFYSGRELPETGTVLRQPALGAVLAAMASGEQGAEGDRSARLRAGRDVFYRGAVAERIVECSKGAGGVLSPEDLAGYSSAIEEPISTSFAGHRIHGQGPWTQGAVALQALNMLEHFDLGAMGHNSTRYIHTVVEALKLAMADREAYYGDPDFAAVPISELLSKEYGAERARLIDPDRPHAELPPPGRLQSAGIGYSPVELVYPGSARRTQAGHASTDGTTHIAAQDSEGNLACSTPSGGSFAKSVFFPDLGFALSTRMEMFNFVPGHPNALAPGKRPRTTLINYIATRDGVPVMTFGCPGGDHQAQANLQLMLNTFVFGMNPQEAIEAPRFATDSVPNSFYPHVYYPGQLSAEDALAQETVYDLKVMGHRVVRATVCGMGATITARDPETGVMSAGADPRRACYALGW